MGILNTLEKYTSVIYYLGLDVLLLISLSQSDSCNPMDFSLSVSYAQVIFQARKWE